MSSINPDSSRPRPPRPPRFEDTSEGDAGPLEGHPRQRPGFPAGEGRPDSEPGFPRDVFQRGPRHGFGPHGHPRPPHNGAPSGEGPLERPAPPDPAKMAEQLVAKADTDSDGVLTVAELSAYYQEMSAFRRPGASESPAGPEMLAIEPQADAEALSEAGEATEPTTVSDILTAGLTSSVTETSSTEQQVGESNEPVDLQNQMLAWLASILQDPRFVELPEEQQLQIQEAAQAVKALDPTDPSYLESLQALLQTYGLAD